MTRTGQLTVKARRRQPAKVEHEQPRLRNVNQGPETAETPAKTRHVGIA
jgi:hypothetical protein